MKNDTPCKECVFAVYTDDGITQTDCSRGMIEKYKNAGSIILEAYDEDKEFYVIKDRICPFFRKEKWLSRFKDPDDIEMIEKVLDFETSPSFHVILFMNDDKSLEGLSNSIESLNKQILKPYQLTVIKKVTNKLRPKDITDVLKSCEFKWRLENLVVEMTDEQITHAAHKGVTSQFYVVIEAGNILDPNIFSDIKTFIIDQVQQFAMIHAEGVTIIPVHIHDYFYLQGDLQKTIVENIKDYQCQNPEKQMVFQYPLTLPNPKS